jgi:hypothetical protein
MVDKRKSEPEEDDKCTHPLLCADEWKDPEGAKVIAEFHKDDELDDEKRIEEDLDAFEKYWQNKHGINFQGEYHKEGAPYVEKSSGWDGHRPRGLAEGGTIAATESVQSSAALDLSEERAKEVGSLARAQEPSTAEVGDDRKAKNAVTMPPEVAKESKEKGEPLKLTEVVDINTLEVISYWIFRIAFGKELHIPIKKEGLADIDVHINNKDITVNTNQLYFAFPELVVWHITYTHKGRPILEIGRGVKKGLKIHRINAFRLLMEVWMGSKRAEKESRMAELKPTVPGQAGKSQRTKDNQDLKEKGDTT